LERGLIEEGKKKSREAFKDLIENSVSSHGVKGDEGARLIVRAGVIVVLATNEIIL
jgi:hypothetical protein